MSLDIAQARFSFHRPLQSSIGDLRRSQESVSACLQEWISECESQRNELDGYRRRLIDLRRKLRRTEKRLAARSDADLQNVQRREVAEADLEAKREELLQATKALQSANAELDAHKKRLELQLERNQHLDLQSSRLEQDGLGARAELSELRTQLAPLVESAAAAARLQAELEAARAELERVTRLGGKRSEDPKLKEQLANLAALKDELTSAKAELRQSQEKLSALQSQAGRDQRELELQKERLKQQSSDKEELATDRDALRDDLRRLQAQIGPLLESATTAARLQAELESARAELERLTRLAGRQPDESKTKEQLASLGALKEELANARAALSQGQERLSALQAQALSDRQALALQVERNQQQASDNEQLSRDRDALREDLRHLQAQIAPLLESGSTAARLQGELEVARAELERLARLEAKRPDDAKIKEQLAGLAALKDELAAARADLTQAQEKLAAIQIQAGRDARERELQAERNRQQAADNQAVAQDRDALREALHHLQAQIAPLLESAATAARLQGELDTTRGELERAALLAAKQPDDAKLKEQLASLTSLKNDLAAARKELAQSGEELKSLRAQADEAQRNCDLQVERNRQQAVDLQRLEGEGERSRGELSQLRAQLAPLVESATTAARLQSELEAARKELDWFSRLETTQPCDAQLQAQLAHVSELEGDLSTSRQELAHREEKLSTVERELAANQQKLESQIERNRQQADQIERLRQEAESSREELKELRTLLAPFMQSADQVGALKAELQSARAELAARPTEETDTQDLKLHLAEALYQRREVETELDHLRGHNAELLEALEGQKRLATVRHAEWTDEMRQLRKAIERQAQMMARGAIEAAIAAPGASTAAPTAQAAASPSRDAVLGSVLEQFEMLQKSKLRKPKP